MILVHVEVERNTDTVADDEKIRYRACYYFMRVTPQQSVTLL